MDFILDSNAMFSLLINVIFYKKKGKPFGFTLSPTIGAREKTKKIEAENKYLIGNNVNAWSMPK